MSPLARRVAVAIVIGAPAGCTAAHEPEATVVDVVVATPSATAVATTSATAASTVKVAVDPGPTAISLDDNPRRVLLPPPPLPATASSLPPQTAVPLMPANVAMLSPVFAALAASQASNATPDGQPIGGTFKQGDTLHLPVTLQPGRCYTIIAVSAGITELDIALTVSSIPGMPMPPMILAQDSSTGPTAVIGGGGNCFKNPTPIAMPATAVIRAATGAGTVLGQAFSR